MPLLEASLVMMLVHNNHLMAVTLGVLGMGLPATLKIIVFPSALLYFSLSCLLVQILCVVKIRNDRGRLILSILVCKVK